MGKPTDDATLSKMFKALAHPNRFRLFREIWEKGGESQFEDGHACFLHDIMERLNVGAPTVSHHLKELVEAELIVTEKQGKFVLCRLNHEALTSLRRFFAVKASPSAE
jgi:ArsR family transcriptional regulator